MTTQDPQTPEEMMEFMNNSANEFFAKNPVIGQSGAESCTLEINSTKICSQVLDALFQPLEGDNENIVKLLLALREAGLITTQTVWQYKSGQKITINI